MLIKNLRHRVRLAIANLEMARRHDVLIEKGVTIKYGRSISFGAHCTVQSGAYLYGSRSRRKVVFGRNVVVGAGGMVLGEGGLTVGDHTHFGPHVVVTTQYGDSTADMSAEETVLKYLAVSIGRGCWIGAGAVIMPGTILGPECVVAPNSVVYGEWGERAKLAGNPARPARILGRPPRHPAAPASSG